MNTASAYPTDVGRDAVECRRVFKPADYAVFTLIYLARLAAIAVFAVYWFTPGPWKENWAGHLLVTTLLTAAIAGPQFRWTFLPFMARPVPMEPRPDYRVAAVTTCVPVLEPLDTIERTLRALVELDYPHDTWILDEGDDPAVRALCARLGVHHFSRKGRPAYQQKSGPFAAQSKHGNYNAWLAEIGYSNYDILLAFDPDHVPRSEYASASIGFFSDSSVGYVQAPQVYHNQSASLIARGAAEETYAYYSVIQTASFGLGQPILTGCHNGHRLSALQEVGGFPDHTADDLTLTLRYQAAGWRGVYVPRVLATGQAPETWPAYLTQQLRWARSVLDIKLRRMGEAGGVPTVKRAIDWFQGFGYLQDALVATATLVLLVTILSTGRFQNALVRLHAWPTALLVVVFAVSEIYRQRFYLVPKEERGLHWRALLLRAAKWPYTLLALLHVIRDTPFAYQVTPKKGVGGSGRMLVVPHAVIAGALALAAVTGSAFGWPVYWLVYLWAGLLGGLSLFFVVWDATAGSHSRRS